MQDAFGRLFRIPLLIALIAISTHAFSQAKAARIAGNVDENRIQRMRGNMHPLIRAAQDLGSVDPAMQMERVTLVFKPTPAQQAALDKLLAEQQDPNSPNFHKWLTPAEFGDRFGLAPADLAKVQAWLTSHGLRVVEAPRSRTYIAFSGTAEQISGAFRTAIHRYSLEGKSHFANSTEPAIPAALSEVVQAVGSLNNFRPRPRISAHRVFPQFTSSISGYHFLAPDDFATIYNLKSLYNNGNDGTGQKIAVMGQTDINISDTTTFRSVSGLPVNNPTKQLIAGSANPGIVSGDDVEANLDVQWAGAVAPKASILYVFSTNALNSMQYAIANNLAPIISISYGDCEANFSSQEITLLNQLGQQANSQGQTIAAPSGDSGAADCDYHVAIASHGFGIDLPGAMPYATSVGGTTFNEGASPSTYWSSTNNSSNGSALSYIPEVGWNDTTYELAKGGYISATGGGKSTLYTKPSWQTGSGVPNDNARDVPDISVNGSAEHDGYLICDGGSCVNGYRAADNSLLVSGGTSAGAPAFAGIVALINQKAGSRQGNVNSTLYAMAVSAPNSFHDVTSGDNKVPCTSGSTDCPAGTTSIGYTAGTGYDYVTGLGSLNVSNLVTQWPASVGAPDFSGSATTSSMTLTRISTASSGTQNITFTAQNGFTGTITLSCSVSTSLTAVGCSMNPASLTNSGTSVLTVTIPAKSSARTSTVAYLVLPFVAGFMLIGFGTDAGNSKRNRLLRALSSRIHALVLLTLLLLFLAFALSGCGGSGSSSSSGSGGGSGTSTPLSGTVTVQATSGSISHSIPISVTVN